MLQLIAVMRLLHAVDTVEERDEARLHHMRHHAPWRAAHLRAVGGAVQVFARLRNGVDHRRDEERGEDQRDGAGGQP